MIRHGGTALAAAALLAATLAQADFQTALKDYNAGRYDVAHGEFLALAELGDCSSQFNLGAMALKGQGGPADTASGVGWLEAAAGNGCQQLVGGKLTHLSAGLTPEQSRAAAQIVSLYGRDSLRAQGVVDPDFTCSGFSGASAVSAPAPEYPQSAAQAGRAGIVIATMVIGLDGRASDPEILLSVPDEHFAAAAVEAWLNWRFTPAQGNGTPVASRLQLKQVFALSGAPPLADLDTYRSARSAADADDPAAAYLVGLTAANEPSLGIAYPRATQMLLSAARAGGPQAQYWVGSQLRTSASCHPHADGAIWLHQAAEGGSGPAQVALARELLAGTPADGQIAQARKLLSEAARSDDYYARKHAAALLAASPVAALHDPAAAQRAAAKLAAGAIQSDPQMFEVVALAHAANGEFRDAISQQDVAIAKARLLGWDTRGMSDRLGQYRAGKSWSGDLFAPP
jgi:TonB family protein